MFAYKVSAHTSYGLPKLHALFGAVIRWYLVVAWTKGGSRAKFNGQQEEAHKRFGIEGTGAHRGGWGSQRGRGGWCLWREEAGGGSNCASGGLGGADAPLSIRWSPARSSQYSASRPRIAELPPAATRHRCQQPGPPSPATPLSAPDSLFARRRPRPVSHIASACPRRGPAIWPPDRARCTALCAQGRAAPAPPAPQCCCS